MQTTSIGPRRSVAPQRQASRNTRLVTAEGQRSQDVVTLSQSLAANTLTQDTTNNLAITSVAGESASITQPTVSEHFNPSDRQMDFGKSAVTSLESNLDVQRKSQSLIGTSQGNILKLLCFEFDHCQIFSPWLNFSVHRHSYGWFVELIILLELTCPCRYGMGCNKSG